MSHRTRRLRVRVQGTVQGVGFRPHVYRLATGEGLTGLVRNDADGVLIEIEGAGAALERFLTRLRAEVPPLARIDGLAVEEAAPRGADGFAIAASHDGGPGTALVTPDTATCADCLRELFDPADRRFRYPFINCTNCGPRFTIVTGIPYDRPNTTMAGFRMCAACQREYDDPADRRFHAQPNACPTCGPAARLVDAGDRPAGPAARRDPVDAAATALRDGAIVGVKGLGGFHLACRADDERAVRTLRERKHREDKPFALMVPDVERAGALVVLGDEEHRLLVSPERPIVLARRRRSADIALAVAPGHRDLGVMLAYTPLHQLLLADLDGLPLVMTSGNVSDEPIAWRDAEARQRLADIADLFLLHDRPIATRTDDSVARVVTVGGQRRPMLLRRSRGYVPVPLPLPESAGALLACGAELKNTFCVARGARAWVGHHIGDLENWETLRAFQEGIDHFEHLFAVQPQTVAHDLHPDYLSTRYALDRTNVLAGIQHHHAHLAACLAEHGEAGPAVGAIYDGTGYGTDGTIWGGEVLVGDLRDFVRAGHLRTVRLPGGAAAIRQPWRMACAWLTLVAGAAPEIPGPLEDRVDPAAWRIVAQLAGTGVASPVTSSMGRLFDAVAAMCGLRTEVTYEGQAAIELEMAADPTAAPPYPFPLSRNGGGTAVLDPLPLLRRLLADLHAGVPVPVVAGRFHASVADATAEACLTVARAAQVPLAVLSGGVFQNVLLLERTAARLEAGGLRVLVPRELPPNDGGIAYGQAAVAATRAVRGQAGVSG